MTVQDVEKKLEAVWASLVAEVHALFHKDTQVADTSPHADPAPTGAPVEVAAPVVAEAPKAVAPEDNPILDAYRHSNAQYVDVKPGDSGPAVPQVDGQGNVLFVEKTGQNIVVDGPGTRTLHVPDGWKGMTRVVVGLNPGTKYPYSVFVNEQPLGTATTNAAVSGEFANPSTLTVRIDQAGDSSVTLEFYNEPA